MTIPGSTQKMAPMKSSTSERTNVLVATAGLALVLLVSPLSTLMTVAVILTMVGIALTYRLTANPVQVVRAEVPAEQPRPQRTSPHR